MIRLLQPEIDIEPGRRAVQPTSGLNTVGRGGAILEITNTTPQENAYTIRLRCDDNPYWQEEWHTLVGLPPHDASGSSAAEVQAAKDAAVAMGKADQYGPHHRWMKVFVSSGQTRHILLNFFVEQAPEGRAGRYPFVVAVETFVSGGGTGAGPEAAGAFGSGAATRRTRFTEVPGVAVVRPFYKWSLDLLPEDGRSVGLLRRKADWEAVVSNEGNDWLYCELKLPRSRDLLIDTPTVRVAVPPPEPGEEKFQRTVPLLTGTKLRAWKGERINQGLPLSAIRLDAPSVAPLLPDVPASASLSLGTGSVLETETSEAAQAPSDRALTYVPPFGLKSGGFTGALQNIRNLIFVGVGFIAFLHVWAIGWEHIRYQAKAEPLKLSVVKGEKLVVAGVGLNGSRILIKGDKGEDALDAHLGNSQAYKASSNVINGAAMRILSPLQPMQRQYLEASVPYDKYQGQKVEVSVQRAYWVPWLRNLMPKVKCSTPVQIGSPRVTEKVTAATTHSLARPGELLPITDPTKQFGTNKGTVTIGGQNADVEKWSDGEITVRVPADINSDSASEVVITTADEGVIRLKSLLKVVPLPTPTPFAAPTRLTTLVPTPAAVLPTPAAVLPTPNTASPLPDPHPSRGGGRSGRSGRTGRHGGGGHIAPTPGLGTTPRIGSNPNQNFVVTHGPSRDPRGGLVLPNDRSTPLPVRPTLPSVSGLPPSGLPSSGLPPRTPIDSGENHRVSGSLANRDAYSLLLWRQPREAFAQASKTLDNTNSDVSTNASMHAVAALAALETTPVRSLDVTYHQAMAQKKAKGRGGRVEALALLAQARNFAANDREGRTQVVESLLRNAISTDPTLVMARTDLVRLLWNTGNQRAAKSEQSACLRVPGLRPDGPTDPAACFDYAACSFAINDRGDAQRYLARAIQADPACANFYAVQDLINRIGR